jgi:para-aminobenzoate synthetase component 1
MVYLAEERNVSFQVGGGITAQSDPEQEYEECLLKGKALLQLGMENTSE